TDQSDLLTELFKAKGIVIGSCTVNNTVLRSIAALLDEIKGHKLKNKFGAAFGSFGWSGEAPVIINNALEQSGIETLGEIIKFKYRPTLEELDTCREYGKKLALKIKQ
ncbi:MAG: anaerobic nitric oxide reductase flavorubredoxin, partial [Bacillota bacterium]|nr:anaerobic nitric oxide reductase flavorubredoxin [Bacillota bacterium]